MAKMRTHVTDLLPGYALGSLEESEMTLVAEHLATCAPCQEELRAYQAVSDRLGLAAAESSPSPGLKEAVLAHIGGDRQKSGAGAKGAPASWWERVRVAWRGLSPVVGMAGLVAVVALAASNVILWQQVRQLETKSIQPLPVVALRGTGSAAEATGMLIMSQDRLSGTLVVDELPELSEELVYQLWLIRDGERTSGGIFTVTAKGYGALELWPGEPLSDYQAFGITIEPAGGSEGPTGERVLAGEL